MKYIIGAIVILILQFAFLYDTESNRNKELNNNSFIGCETEWKPYLYFQGIVPSSYSVCEE
jgi:hypothetical protein